MRHIKICFEDEVFKGLETLKKKAGLTWEQFIIKSVWEKFIIKPVETDGENKE